MSDGRTVWWSKDAAWHRRERIVQLGLEFGAEGPMVMDTLSSMAKEQNSAGRVKAGYSSLTREGFVGSEQTTRKIVERAVALGALDDFNQNGLMFTARVSGWKADQDHARAAARQHRHRAKTNPKQEA